MKSEIHNSDVLKWCEEYDGEKFHSLICDPPYHLISGNAVYDFKQNKGKRKATGGGFMGKDWDGGDIAFRPETWAALGEHLHPGAFCFAFASTRGVHRMACAIEDAGFILHPTIFLYSFGSGFPKATRIDTQIDRAAGAEREVIGITKAGKTAMGQGSGWNPHNNRTEIDVTEPATDLAKAWQGHRYGRQSLKPAVEPIICFQLPYTKGRKPVDCITETGAGALNIDASRIEAEPELAKNWQRNQSTAAKEGRNAMSGGLGTIDLRDYAPNGRWPANFCVDEEAARRLDLQSGNTTGKQSNGGSRYLPGAQVKTNFMHGDHIASNSYDDTGGASRFFFNTDWNYEVAERLAESEPVFYTGKASRRERNAGCEENENNHPTVKPIALSKWLSTLLLPPIEYSERRLLVPFAGVGSEMIGAALAGWEVVQGIEQSAEYVEIARARLRHHTGLFADAA